MGSKCHNSGGQLCLGCALLTGWLLGRSCSSSPPMTPLLHTETSMHLSLGHGWSHCVVTLLYSLRPILLHGENALGGWEGAPDAPWGQARKEGPSSQGCNPCPFPSCTSQGALLLTQPPPPVLKSCSPVTAPSFSTVWALLQGLQGSLSCCGIR